MRAPLQLEAIKRVEGHVTAVRLFLRAAGCLNGPVCPLVEFLLRVLVKHPWNESEEDKRPTGP